MYSYDIDVCDVVNKDKLKEYRELRRKWIEHFDQDEYHSIWPQITKMLWRDALFRVVNEARRITAQGTDPNIGINGPISNLIDIGFVTVQTTTIRRLVERNWSDPTRGVVSLRRVLNEMRENRELITRENYVSHDGLPFDPKPVCEEWQIEHMKDSDNAVGIENSGPKAWPTSESANKTFDKLAGIDASKRQRSDLIERKVFDILDNKLDECESVCTFVDKFIAHAADDYSRSGLIKEERGVSLSKLDISYKAVYQVSWNIYGKLLWKGTYLGGIPIPQYDHLKNLDKPWMTSDSLSRARDLWWKREKEIQKWGEDIL